MSNNARAAANPITEYHGLSPNSPSSKIDVVINAIKAAKNNSKIGANSPFLMMPVLLMPSIIRIKPIDKPIAHNPGASSYSPKAKSSPPIITQE
jgi:hypothetical protein